MPRIALVTGVSGGSLVLSVISSASSSELSTTTTGADWRLCARVLWAGLGRGKDDCPRGATKYLDWVLAPKPLPPPLPYDSPTGSLGTAGSVAVPPLTAKEGILLRDLRNGEEGVVLAPVLSLNTLWRLLGSHPCLSLNQLTTLVHRAASQLL